MVCVNRFDTYIMDVGYLEMETPGCHSFDNIVVCNAIDAMKIRKLLYFNFHKEFQ